MLPKIEALPHEEAQINLMYTTAIGATVENNIEHVYDFIVAEDVHLNFIGGEPRMLGYDIEIGPWNHSGATRITRFEGDFSFRETIIGCERPYYFQYMVTEFQGGGLDNLIDLIIASFVFSSHGPRTRINWQYQMRPVNQDQDKLAELKRTISEGWYPFQEFFINKVQGALNKDPWST